MGRRAGLSAEELAAIVDFEPSPRFCDLDKAVLRYAQAMSRTPVVVADELFAELARHLDAKQLVELTSAIAWENYRARFDHALDIASAGFLDGADG